MGYQEIKLEWPEVPRIKLKLLFICHLIFISWSSLGEQSRGGSCVEFFNFNNNDVMKRPNNRFKLHVRPAAGSWADQAVLVHNLLFLFTFVWAIVQHEDEDSVFLCLAINLVSLVLDTVILGARYPARSPPPPYTTPGTALCSHTMLHTPHI